MFAYSCGCFMNNGKSVNAEPKCCIGLTLSYTF